MSARDLAISRIARQARRFPDLDLRGGEREGAAAGMQLEPRDVALASAIEHAVHRRWLTLSAVIESRLSRPWPQVEPKLQAALLCGAAQLLLLDRLPDYAVIDETVAWAKHRIRPKAGGFVNAVLRKIAAMRVSASPAEGGCIRSVPLARDVMPLRDGRVLRLSEAVFDEHELPRLAQQTSHSAELLEHWTAHFGRDKVGALALHSIVHAPVIVHGVAAEDVAQPWRVQPHRQPGFLVLDLQRGEGNAHAGGVAEFLRAHPQAIVQDPASAAAVLEAAPLIDTGPKVIIDACAGRGTKTRQLARAFPHAEITATDIDEDRMASLRATFEGDPRVRIVDYRALLERAGAADLVVLDVPCSNSGVLARRVEAKYRFTPAALTSVVDLQRQIIADGLRLLSDRGRILYVTCSVDPTENQQQARWITHWHPLEIEHERRREPSGLPGDDPANYNDGGYWALLRRRAGASARPR